MQKADVRRKRTEALKGETLCQWGESGDHPARWGHLKAGKGLKLPERIKGASKEKQALRWQIEKEGVLRESAREVKSLEVSAAY